MSIGRHKLRSFLSILGIIFGIIAVTLIISVGEGAKKEIVRQIEALGTHNIYLRTVPLTESQQINAGKNRSRGLNLGDVAQINSLSGSIEHIAYSDDFEIDVTVMNEKITPHAVAVSSRLINLLGLKVSQGRFITDLDNQNSNQVCVIGRAVAEGLREKGRLGSRIPINGMLFTIVGLLPERQDKTKETKVILDRDINQSIFIPYSLAKWVKKQEDRSEFFDEAVTEIVIRVKQTGQIEAITKKLEKLLDVTHKGVKNYRIISPFELLEQSRKAQNTLNLSVGSIATIALVVGGIGIMNIMLANISERKKEIGLRRAVGATKYHIIVQFLLESLLLTGFGGIIGVIFGTILILGLSFLLPWPVVIGIKSIFLPFLMAILIGLFFGYYPARQAADLNPIDALRYE